MSLPASSPDLPLQGRWLLILLIVLCAGVEGFMQLVELAGASPRLRATLYEMGGFWPGLLGQWQPNYRLQPYAMFLTYGFLHGGLLHLIVNMITLWSLGREVIVRAGPRGFALLYVGAMIGGGLGYAVLGVDTRPMVGASGALFGLAGGLLAWAWQDRGARAETRRPVLLAVAVLAALNLVLWGAMGGQLAWQAHLGGFVTGWGLAGWIDPRTPQVR